MASSLSLTSLPHSPHGNLSLSSSTPSLSLCRETMSREHPFISDHQLTIDSAIFWAAWIESGARRTRHYGVGGASGCALSRILVFVFLVVCVERKRSALAMAESYIYCFTHSTNLATDTQLTEKSAAISVESSFSQSLFLTHTDCKICPRPLPVTLRREPKEGQTTDRGRSSRATC